MAIKLLTKTELVGGGVFLGFMGLVFLLMAVLGDQFLLDRIRVSGTVLTPEHPDFARYLSILRWSAGFSGIVCLIFGWLSFRSSRSIADNISI